MTMTMAVSVTMSATVAPMTPVPTTVTTFDEFSHGRRRWLLNGGT